MSQLLEHSGIGPASRDLYYSIQLHNYFLVLRRIQIPRLFLGKAPLHTPGIHQPYRVIDVCMFHSGVTGATG